MILIDRRHLRTRLAIAFITVLGVVSLVYSAASGFLLLRDLRSQLTRYAIQDIANVEGLLYFTPTGEMKLHEDYFNHPESKNVLERLVEVRTPQGQLLFRNDLLGNRSLGDAILPGEGEGGYSPREFILSDGLRVELVSRYHYFGSRPTIIRLAHSQEPLRAEFRSALTALLLPLPLVLFLVGAGGYLLAANFLKPLQKLAQEADAINSDRLHQRLPVNPADGELADLARTFNALLVRLEQSFDQLRRFTSDASHELRTPLAAIRSVGEVALQKHGSAESYRDVIGSMLEEANKLTQLVDNLLTIARADGGQLHLNRSIFTAATLTQECAAMFEVLLEEKHQHLTVRSESSASIHGDWLLLRQAIVNVLHNAIKHTPAEGSITLSTRSTAAEILIEIADTGPGIPEDQLTKIFDRFYRVDEGRSRDTGGVGLGLSIARWNVEINGGSITAFANSSGGSTFRVTLPLADAGDSPDASALHVDPALSTSPMR